MQVQILATSLEKLDNVVFELCAFLADIDFLDRKPTHTDTLKSGHVK